ncbi:hypothetical protein [Pseudonocardia sp.]|uniref:hypothetical protein n=1 Tax=Pseudonocardia sp. TaxID=60912 RepID=UPI002633D340|nr:hypothetical protein [Pseudonocardia sp.]
MTRSFTVRGTRNGSLVHVTWTDGTLTGDPPTVDLLEVQADIADTMHGDDHAARAFPALAALPPHPLADPSSAYRLIIHVFDSVRQTEGAVPRPSS